MSSAVARIGDPISCGDTIAQGSGDVFVNNIPAVRLGDMTIGHTPPGHTLYPPTPIINGSGSVFVNNLPLARFGDAIATHTDPGHPSSHPHAGTISVGSSDVFSG